MALVRCILRKFLGVVCHCFPLPLDVPTFAARCLHVLINASAPSSERWNNRARNGRRILPVTQLPCNHRVLYHAANLRHGINGFTSLPKEGMLQIFSPEKIRRLRPGLNPRTPVPEASMLATRPLYNTDAASGIKESSNTIRKIRPRLSRRYPWKLIL
jgi:hypothetical protein